MPYALFMCDNSAVFQKYRGCCSVDHFLDMFEYVLNNQQLLHMCVSAYDQVCKAFGIALAVQE